VNALITDAVPTFQPASPQAAAISSLFVLTLVVAAVIFVIVAGSIAYIVLRYRGRGGAAEPRQDFGQPKLEIAWTLASLLIVAFLFGATVVTVHSSDPTAGGQRPDLVVVGHQWWWEVRYPQSGVVTANEIHMPIDQHWLVRLESADVIHDFWVPELGRKMDMVPGHPNYIWLQASTPGVYLGTCSEFCGAQHAWMRIRVIAQSPAEFAAWEAQQLQVPAVPASGAAAAGARRFQELTCVNCHTIAGTAAAARVAPDLTHLASRDTLGAGVVANTPGNLVAWLTNPQAIKPGSNMPYVHLSSADVGALAAYMESLK
jgi:cytochrome c oxidase subunit 2